MPGRRLDLKVLCEGKKTLRNAFSPKLGASVMFDKGSAVDATLLLAENSKDFTQSQTTTLSFLCSSLTLLSIVTPNNNKKHHLSLSALTWTTREEVETTC